MLQEKSMPKIYGELALLLAVCINSFGVVLMLYSGFLGRLKIIGSLTIEDIEEGLNQSMTER